MLSSSMSSFEIIISLNLSPSLNSSSTSFLASLRFGAVTSAQCVIVAVKWYVFSFFIIVFNLLILMIL